MNIFKKHEIHILNKSSLFFKLLLVASPWLILYISTILLGHPISESIPVWSDELSYWHEILSLSQKGIQHGYYTYNELTPAFSAFGPHGFGTVSVYALFAKLYGWKTYSMLIANATFMSLAFIIFAFMLKPKPKLVSFILLFTVSYTPYILFSITSMSEVLNYAMLTVYFSLMYMFVQRGSNALFYSLLVICTAFSFVRIIYIVLFLPLLFIRNKECKFDLKLVIYTALWVIFSVIIFVISSLFVSPYPYMFLNEFFGTIGIAEKLSLFAVHFTQNILNFVNPFSDSILQVFERYFVLLVLIYCFVKSNLLQSKLRNIEIRYFVVFLILFSVLLITFGAYDVFDWRDYRVLAPVLYGSAVYLMMNSKSKEFSALLAFNVLVFVFMITSTQTWESFTVGRYIKPTTCNVLKRIEYTTNVRNCFDNTLALKSFNQQFILNVPSGIGITTVDSLSDKLQSRYIFSEKILNINTYKLIVYDKFGFLYAKR